MNVQPPIAGVKPVRRVFEWLLAMACAYVLAFVIIPAFLRSPADETFRWFNSLGFPDVAGRPYVNIATGGWSQSGNDQPQGEFIHGFLLSQSNATFTVLTKDLSVRTFNSSAHDTPAHMRVGFELMDLPKEANSYLELLKNPPKDSWRRFRQRLQERSEIFVLAWACERNGQPVLARQLFDQALAKRENVPPATNWFGRITIPINKLLKRPQKQLDMIEQLERDISHAMMWRAVVEFGETNLTRRQLLGQFREILNKYPRSPHRERAKDTSDRLVRMIAEDDAHRKITETELERVPVEKRVGELIFCLRDQNGHQWGQPGWCDIFDELRGTTNTPAHQLVRIGYPAVPKLIATLDDQTFTRSVGYHRNFYFSHSVLTVGDCAATILHRITGKSFYSPGTTSGYMSKDGKISATRKAAEDWWAEFQKKGERKTLIEATERGDDDSPAQARMLFERYPADALASVVRGATKANRDWTRDQLVEIATRVPGDAPVPFLQEEMATGPYLQSQVTAARALHERGRAEAVRTMISKWRELGSTNMPDETSDVEALIQFLANCDRPEAVEALGDKLRQRPVALRVSVISAFAERHNYSGITDGGFGLNPSQKHNTQPEQAATATERLLATSLEDTEQRMGMSGSWDNKSFVDPRICDIGGHVLSQRWPTKYPFNLGASQKQRERQRIECLNIWRTQNHLPVLPLPLAKRVTPVPDEKIQPVLQRIRVGRTKDEVAGPMRELERFGIAALSAARKLCEELPEQHAARAGLLVLNKQLASSVTEIRFTERSLEPTGPFLDLLRGHSNAPLSSAMFVDILLAVANDPDGAASAIEVKAMRDDDLAGVSIEIKLTTERAKQAGTQKGWKCLERVTVKDGGYNSSGGNSLEYGATREAYGELSAAIDKALATEPDEPFTISSVLKREE